MGLITKIVQCYGNEKAFIKKFIHTVTAADSRITCDKTDSDIDTEYSSSDNPAFTLNFDNAFTAYFRRHFSTGNICNYFDVTLTSSANSNYSKGSGISYINSNNSYAGNVLMRTWNLRIVTSTNAIIFHVSNFDNSILSPSYYIQGMFVREGSTVAVSFGANASDGNGGIGTSFYIGDTAATAVHRLPYINNIENSYSIEVINSKVLKYSSQAAKYVTLTGLHDCSTLTAGKEIKVGNQKFYTLNANTLISL